MMAMEMMKTGLQIARAMCFHHHMSFVSFVMSEIWETAVHGFRVITCDNRDILLSMMHTVKDLLVPHESLCTIYLCHCLMPFCCNYMQPFWPHISRPPSPSRQTNPPFKTLSQNNPDPFPPYRRISSAI